jgi:hypothetical protein
MGVWEYGSMGMICQLSTFAAFRQGIKCYAFSVRRSGFCVKRKSRWALLKTRFRNSLSSLDENRERNFVGFQRTANGRHDRVIYDFGFPCSA